MKYILIPILFVLLISCDDEKDYVAENEAEILTYLEENDLVAQRSESGLHYIINNPGSGRQATAASRVQVVYRGYYTDGTVFDESDANGIVFGLNQVISGWTEGIAYFKEGGSGMLLIPAHLGYGNDDYAGIPGGSVLLFDITLVSVN
ncbi:MAG: FKBP-type peptidyl-prolyl cis-trans isomerase [Reichenbachiella sp.]